MTFLTCPICGGYWTWGRDVQVVNDYARPVSLDDPKASYARLNCPYCGMSYQFNIPTKKGKAVKNWRDLMEAEVNRRHIMAAFDATHQADVKLHAMLQEVQRTTIMVWEKQCKMKEDEIRRAQEKEDAEWKEEPQ